MSVKPFARFALLCLFRCDFLASIVTRIVFISQIKSGGKIVILGQTARSFLSSGCLHTHGVSCIDFFGENLLFFFSGSRNISKLCWVNRDVER